MSASTVSIVPRETRADRQRWFECTRKRVVYATRDRAERAAVLRTQHDQVNRIEARPWTAYACRFCGSYHIGHVRKAEPCGICDRPHVGRYDCHCPRLRSWCERCVPLGGDK